MICNLCVTLCQFTWHGLCCLKIKIANKKLVYIANLGGQPSASATARLLAAKSAKSGRNVVLYDTTGQLEKEIKNKPSKNNSDTTIMKLDDNISVMTGAEGASLFTSTNFKLKIKDLIDQFDQIFLCTSNRNAQLGLMALLDFAPALVMISGMRKTKKTDIKNIIARQPIDLLFHD